jgi:HSP20 family protein
MIKDSGIWDEVEKLRGGFEDLFRAGLGFAGRGPSSRLLEKPDEFVVLVELPGVHRDAVQVAYRDRSLVVSGNKPAAGVEEGTVLRDETFSGAFERAIGIPSEVDGDAIQARFQDGMLRVRLPKTGKERPRTVKID